MKKSLSSFFLLACLVTPFVGCSDTIERMEECLQHIFAAIGTGYTRKENDLYKNKYFLVYDNGYWSKEHHYYPFWRKHKPMNLHYIVKPANR